MEFARADCVKPYTETLGHFVVEADFTFVSMFGFGLMALMVFMADMTFMSFMIVAVAVVMVVADMVVGSIVAGAQR